MTIKKMILSVAVLAGLLAIGSTEPRSNVEANTVPAASGEGAACNPFGGFCVSLAQCCDHHCNPHTQKCA
jgi:hypothetical protein